MTDTLRMALREAIDVFEGQRDDEIEVELLPRLRAALNEKGLADYGHGQHRDKTLEDFERASAVLSRARAQGDDPSVELTAKAALKSAIYHIEHMAAFITAQNAGYSFEGLGEDMPGIRAALGTTPGNPR